MEKEGERRKSSGTLKSGKGKEQRELERTLI